MPPQLSNSNHTCARVNFARRFMLAAALSVVTIAPCISVPVFAQNATKPQPTPSAVQAKPTGANAKPPTTNVKPAGATVKTSDGAAKPASSASEITRARRAATVVAPAAAVPVDDAPALPAAPEKDALELKAVPLSEEAELERLRVEIKDAKAGAERARLQRALVDGLVALKRNDEALDALRLMIHEDRFDPPFFFNTGNALARLGDASAAEDAYRKAILQRRGNYARALNNLGVILIRQGHWDEAQQTLAAALSQENYAYAEASYNLARLHLLRGEADLAIREWQRTLRLEPAHAPAAVALALAYGEDGNANRGLAVLDSFTARSTRGGTAGVPREIADARRELVAASASADKDEDANVDTGDGAGGGNSGAGGNRVPSASSNADFRARKVDRAIYTLLQTARESRESGSYEESVKNYRAVLQRSPGNYFPPANLELGAVLINLKRDEEAIAALIPLTQKDSARYPIAAYHLGRLYERQSQFARAAHHFERAAELYGDANPQVLLDLSRAREKNGDHAGALTAMNAYAASMARQGTVPPWVAERQAKLNQKVTSATQSSTRSSTVKP